MDKIQANEIDSLSVDEIYKIAVYMHRKISKNDLYEMWTDLSNLELSPDSELCLNEMASRIDDLYYDITDYYTVSRKAFSKYLETFTNFKKNRSTLNYTETVNEFCAFAKDRKILLVDLHQRIAELMVRIDPNSTGKLYHKTSYVTQLSIILKRSQEISTLFDLKKAGKSEFEEFLRLNRRMFVLLKEADLLKFSDLQARRFEAIKSYLVVKLESGNSGDPLFNIILKHNTLKEDIEKYIDPFMHKCMNSELVMDNAEKKLYSFNYCTSENEKMIKDLKNYFGIIVQRFKMFDAQLEEIKEMIDEVWDEA